MKPDKSAHKGESETGPFEVPIVGGVRLKKGLTYTVEELGWDPNTGILDKKSDVVTVRHCRYSGRPAARREFHRVRKQVRYNLLHRSLICNE